MAGTGGVVAREMPVIHACILNELNAVRGFLDQIDPADTARVSAVADHLTFILDMLHMHHTTEDTLVWPQLKVRAAMDATSIDRMEEQHHRIDESVAGVRSASAAWRAAPSAESAAVLRDRLDNALGVIGLHLDEEVREVVPLIDQHFTAAEWKKVGDAAWAEVKPSDRMIALGIMKEVGTPEAEQMVDELPLPAKVLWPLVGKRMYRRYIEPVRG